MHHFSSGVWQKYCNSFLWLSYSFNLVATENITGVSGKNYLHGQYSHTHTGELAVCHLQFSRMARPLLGYSGPVLQLTA